MRKLALILFISCILSCFLYSDSDYRMVKNFTVAQGETFSGSIFSMGGDIEIKGNLDGGIILLGGRLNIEGKINDEIICLGSQVILKPTSEIRNNLFIIGGTLAREKGSIVTGKLIVSELNLKKIEAALFSLFMDTHSIAFIRIIKILIWFIIALIVFALFPRPVIDAGEILERNLKKVALTGLISIVAFIILLSVFLVLCFFIVGIPLLIFLLIFFFIVYIFGRTVIFYYIGEKLSRLFKFKLTPSVVFMVIGAFVYVLLKFLPFVGTILLLILNVFEWGIGVVFFLRKKFKLEQSPCE